MVKCHALRTQVSRFKVSRPGLEPTLCADQTPELESGAPTLGHETPQIKSQSFKPQNGFGPTPENW